MAFVGKAEEVVCARLFVSLSNVFNACVQGKLRFSTFANFQRHLHRALRRSVCSAVTLQQDAVQNQIPLSSVGPGSTALLGAWASCHLL